MNNELLGKQKKDAIIDLDNFLFTHNVPGHKSYVIKLVYNYDLKGGRGLIDLEKIKIVIDKIIKMEKLAIHNHIKKPENAPIMKQSSIDFSKLPDAVKKVIFEHRKKHTTHTKCSGCVSKAIKIPTSLRKQAPNLPGIEGKSADE